MPLPSQIGQSVVTVSDKLQQIGQQGLGTITGFAGTLSSGASQAASAFNAFAGKTSDLLKQGNLSASALSGAAAQITEALQPSSIYKGVPKQAAIPTESKPEMSRPKMATTLKFPSDLGEHYVQFIFETYKKDSPLAKEIKTQPAIIQLPMSPNLTENYQASYKTEALNVLGGLAEQTVKDFEKAGGFNMSAEKAGEQLGKSAVDVAKTSGKAALASLGATMGMAAVPGLGAAVSRALGASVNPNMAVLFDNIGFRSHQFSFRLNPRTPQESATIKQIIAIMRQRMLPPKVNNFFFGFPDKANIKIFPVQPYPILECVLESMSINYAPNGPAFYSVSSGGAPVMIEMQLQFKEIVLFTRETASAFGSTSIDYNNTSNQERDQ